MPVAIIWEALDAALIALSSAGLMRVATGRRRRLSAEPPYPPELGFTPQVTPARGRRR